MKLPLYMEDPEKRRTERAELTSWSAEAEEDAKGYLPDPELINAVNVSLILGQPLLLTGEPGTGKTRLAYSAAWELGFDEPLKFETKSNSAARDLFYTYDTIGRFHAAQTGEGSKNSLDYITYNALGISILRASNAETTKDFFPKDAKDFVMGKTRRSVVLIDEIDKAPRDFPNDILNEIEGMYFKIPELRNAKVEADKKLRPILILTSNSEKHLPDAFLRRCVYYNIPFPDGEKEEGKKRLQNIVEARLGKFAGDGDDSPMLKEALNLFFKLRESRSNLQKKPATAELLGWLIALREFGAQKNESLKGSHELVLKSISALVKNSEDYDRAKAIIEEWKKR